MKWLIYGLLASILFGLWGLFDKLSAFQSPFVSNFIIYFIATIFGFLILILITKKIRFSKYSALAGLFAGVANFFVLYALLQNLLILVLPFVSMAAVIFFFIIYFTEKPKYNQKQKFLAGIGLLLSFLGIFLISTGSVGFFNFINQLVLNTLYIIPAIIIMFGFSLWTYFTYKAVSEKQTDALTYNFWNLGTSFIVAIFAILIFSPIAFSELFSLSSLGYIYPTLAGICIAGGCFLVFSAFQKTTTKTKLQEAIVAILANGELIPLLFLSYFVLGEWATEGFIGILIVLIGLFSLHYSEVSK